MEEVAASILIALFAATGAIVIVYGVHLSNLVRNGSLSSRHETPPYDIIACIATDGRIQLRAKDEKAGAMDLHHEGVFGIVSADGYGQVGSVVEQGEGYAVREYTPLTTTIGAKVDARLDTYAHPDNPLTAHGIPYKKVTYESELGKCPAWHIPGGSNTWVVFAHGRGAHPNEALRILPTLAKAGLPVLAFNYRNDDGAPPSKDRMNWLGLAEWRDLEAAMKYALNNGAEDFILYGYSMGGGMCLNLLYESKLATKVRGVVMNSPFLDFSGTLDFVGRIRNYPRLIVHFGKWLAGWRFGIDWQRMNYLNRASELRVRILILHGEKDELVPASISQSLARARPDIVRYVGFSEAEHTRSWNLDPAKYEAEVHQFVQELLGESR